MSGMRTGQALLEYVLALAGVLLTAAILGSFVRASGQYAVRVDRLVTSEYP